jgi:peptidoglycan/LPS O-acetylase OafA/YrhL
MPVYFMGVFTAIVIFGEASEPWASISLLTFTSNWWMVVNNEGLGLASPYWSVAVEEQFYLIWPLIILVLPRSAIFPAVLATVFFGIMWRLVVGMSGMPEFYGSIATFSAIDALGAGALVACLMRRGLVAQTKALGALGLALALPILAVDYAASATKTELPAGFRFLTYSAYVGAGVWLLVYALCHCNGGVGRLLGIRPVVWVGKRSYGIYAYHMLFYGAASLILGAFGHDGGSFKGLRQLCALIVTMLVADFSFRHIELPILSLRRYFPYSRGSI